MKLGDQLLLYQLKPWQFWEPAQQYWQSIRWWYALPELLMHDQIVKRPE